MGPKNTDPTFDLKLARTHLNYTYAAILCNIIHISIDQLTRMIDMHDFHLNGLSRAARNARQTKFTVHDFFACNGIRTHNV